MLTFNEISLYNFKEHSILLGNLATDVNIIKYNLLLDKNVHCALYFCISTDRNATGHYYSQWNRNIILWGILILTKFVSIFIVVIHHSSSSSCEA